MATEFEGKTGPAEHVETVVTGQLPVNDSIKGAATSAIGEQQDGIVIRPKAHSNGLSPVVKTETVTTVFIKLPTASTGSEIQQDTVVQGSKNGREDKPGDEESGERAGSPTVEVYVEERSQPPDHGPPLVSDSPEETVVWTDETITRMLAEIRADGDAAADRSPEAELSRTAEYSYDPEERYNPKSPMQHRNGDRQVTDSQSRSDESDPREVIPAGDAGDPPRIPPGESPPASFSEEPEDEFSQESQINATNLLRKFHDEIGDGTLQGGNKLPSISEYAEAKNVPYTLARKVYFALASEGLITVTRGYGKPIINTERSEGYPKITNIVEGLRERIVSNDLQEGDRIPTTRELAKLHGLGQREASVVHIILASEDLVDIKSGGIGGGGTFVRVAGSEHQRGITSVDIPSDRDESHPKAGPVIAEGDPPRIPPGELPPVSSSEEPYRLEPEEQTTSRIDREQVSVEEILGQENERTAETFGPGTILRNLREKILRLDIVPGAKLPSTVEVAEQLRVDEKTVRFIYKALEAYGLAQPSRGIGTIINKEEGEGIPHIAHFVQGLRDQISSGALSEGDRLPRIDELVEQNGFSKNEAQVIHLMLKSEGLGKGIHHKGFFVSPRSVDSDPLSEMSQQVPSELEEAAKILSDLRKTHLKIEMAEGIDLDKVYAMAVKFYPESTEALERLDQLRTDFNIFRVLAQPDMTRDRAKDLLRLSMGYSVSKFAEASQIHRITILRIKEDDRDHLAHTANQMLKAARISSDSKAAQLFRLIMNGNEIPNIDQFAGKSSGKRLLYYRTANGLTQVREGDAISHTDSSVSRYELDERIIPPENLDNLLGSENPLYQVMRDNPEGGNITVANDIRNDIFLNGNLLFAEHLMQVRKYPSSTQDSERYHQVQATQQVSEIVRFVIGELSINEVRRRSGVKNDTISNIINGIAVPDNLTILKILSAFGYKFNDLITQDALYKNWLARRGIQSE